MLLAAILGGLAMYIWTSLAHMLLPLGEAGISEIPSANEPAVLSAMQSGIGDKGGLYFFPGSGLGENATQAQKNEAMKQIEEKMKTSPSGLLIYHPPGYVFSFPKSLIIEFLTELAEAILAVYLLSRTSIVTFGGRVGFIFVAGIIAAISTEVPYWNWYSFPGVYTCAQITIHLVGFLCAGIVASLVMGRRT